MASTSIGLSLSGGGYRARRHFIWGLCKSWRKWEFFSQISVISTISGGSIVGANHLVFAGNFKIFKDDFITKIASKNLIVKSIFTYPASRFTLFSILFLAAIVYFIVHDQSLAIFITVIVFLFLLYLFQFQIFPVSKSIEKLYAEYFTNQKKLQDLPEHPRLVVGATNLQTARPFVFSRNFMGIPLYLRGYTSQV
jgi:NTE family protein